MIDAPSDPGPRAAEPGGQHRPAPRMPRLPSPRLPDVTSSSGSEPARSGLAARLRAHVAGDVHFDDFTRGIYSTDASIYQIRPAGVVVPHSTGDVARTVEIVAAAGLSVVPRGGGTSQGGQTIGPGVVVDTSKHMRGVLRVDPDRMTAVVQPGLVLDHLNTALAVHGLFFPVDVATASRATLGGMVGNNSAGARSIRFGHTVEHVRRIDAVLADGRTARFGPVPAPGALNDPAAVAPHGDPASGLQDSVTGPPLFGQERARELAGILGELYAREAEELARRLPRVPRHVAGYSLQRMAPPQPNLAQALVGSEGTLAFFTELELALQPLPAARVLGVCHFESLRAALESVQHIVTLDPTAVELVDRTMMDLARGIPGFAQVLDSVVRGRPAALLLVEFSGSADAALLGLDRLEELLADRGHPGAVVRAEDPAAQARVWQVRKAGLNIATSMKGDTKPVAFIEDCAIPLDRLGEWEERLNGVFQRHGTPAIWYAHASVGLLHVRPALNLKSGADVARMRAITEEAFEIVRDLGGSHSGEHGDGRIRSEFIEPMLGSRLARTFEQIKDAFDPAGVFNPGSIVRVGRMDDRSIFRYGPDYQPRALPTVLDWSAWGGLGGAVEMCNNNGACRKRDPGVMCPSYRVTLDEKHTTRGRANALRLAITGQLGPDAMLSDEMADAMDLCIGCKGCKRECPTGVDMARMKLEVMHARAQKRSPSLRSRAIGSLPRIAPIARRVGGLLNLRNRSGILASLGESLGGVSRRRTLPEWSPDPFVESTGRVVGDGEPVVLFVDTFATWFEPEIARDALSVLEAAEYQVHLPAWPDGRRPLCCGRTFLSAGLVDEARAEMRRTVAALAAFGPAPVVGLEPSCLLTLRDELPALLAGDPDAAGLSERALLLEEILDPLRGADALELGPLSAPAMRVHGRCHEKAFDAVGALQRVLARIPGVDPDVIPSGCCGMAGAFGYEAEHYGLSIAMAELDLLPAVRATPREWVLVANGTSCRHQISDGVGRSALHLAQVLAQALP